MKRLLSLVTLMTLAGCSQSDPGGRFFEAKQTRFKVSREKTPPNFPDLFVIHDALYGTDYLVVEWAMNNCCAITRLDGGGHGETSTNWSKAYFLEK